MAIERLSEEDALMLWPDDLWPQDVGALVMLEGGSLLDPAGRLRLEAARDAVGARLHLVPRFRQLLQIPPRELGGPLWVDAPSFDIAEHVREIPLPAPAGEAELLLATERMRRCRLDRSRPLWEMWFLTGLPERRLGLFVRFHHAIADGMAGIATMASFLDTEAEAAAPAPVTWSPAPAPSQAELLADLRRHQVESRRERRARLAHPLTAGRRLLSTWPALHELLAERPYPVTSLDRVVGPDRRLALIRSRLDLVKEVAHRQGGTVNDVLLAAIAGGLRELLRARGEPVDDVVLGIYVAVSLHSGLPSEARGNLISQMAIPLPIGEGDPAARLRQIAAATSERKARPRPSMGGLPHDGRVGRLVLRLVTRQHVNVMSADLPGPPVPLYFAGARLLEVFPMVQLMSRISLALGALSYAGGFHIMAVADREAYPDLDVFMKGAEQELRALAPREGAAV